MEVVTHAESSTAFRGIGPEAKGDGERQIRRQLPQHDKRPVRDGKARQASPRTTVLETNGGGSTGSARSAVTMAASSAARSTRTRGRMEG